MRRTIEEYRALIDEVKEQKRRNTIGHLRVDYLQFSIDAKTSGKLDQAGGVTLSPEQCVELQYILQLYAVVHQGAQGWQADKNVSKQLKRIRTSFNQLIGALAEINFDDVKLMGEADMKGKLSVKVQAIFRKAGVPPRDFIDELIFLRDEMDRWSTSRKSGRPPTHANLLPLMRELIPVYRAAGGGSVLISRGDRNRRSKFIDFVWVLMQLLPPRMRYESLEALQTWWEKNAPPELRPQKRR